MPDREKTISHFENAITGSGNGNKWRFVRADIIEDALELLKADEADINALSEKYADLLDRTINEQEPVEPRIQTTGSCLTWWNVCGNCNAAINPNDKYCHECGKAVKWE